MDITLTEGPDGKLIMHRPDCPEVQKHREADRPLCTMFGCTDVPINIKRCECMNEVRE